MMLATSTRAPLRAMYDAGAAPRRALGKLDGRRNRSLARRESQRFALVPDMVAGGDDIGAGSDGLAKDLFGDAEAAGGVLAIDDDEVEFEVGDQARQLFPHRRASRFADHVTEEEKSHMIPHRKSAKQKLHDVREKIMRPCIIYNFDPNRRNPLSVSISGMTTSCVLIGNQRNLLAVEGDADQPGRTPLSCRRAIARS